MDPKLVQKDCFDSFTTCIDIVRTDFDKAVELAATLANAELELVRTENRHEYGRLNDNLNETKQCIKEALQKAKKSAEKSLFPAAKAVAKTFNVPMVIASRTSSRRSHYQLGST
ncbi:hypothetical protein L5515_000366 [Caenorhabditis briggsae]|uniref:Uncharacterized protein n=1 Tax=Caenorhabditis briggsae TaxID=6238 RepID=A0AAE9DZA0_CAEBR|nr:hypothetical protein L5515_000366 [Caenorhabditis briggsae]